MPKVNKDDFKPYFEIEIDKAYRPEERRAIAQEIIDEIIQRTESGKDADGKPFVKYSKEYAKEKGQSNVDLTFSGEMLSEIKLLQEKNGKIRIGYEKGYSGIGKVEGNIRGTYGNESAVNKGRNFLGITDSDLNSILRNYPAGDRESLATSKEVTAAARRIASRAQFEEDDGEA